MLPKLFGTDGIRGVGMDAIFNPSSLLKLAVIASRVLQGPQKRVVIGGDTRRSYDMIANSLAAGFMGEGLDVVTVGVASTPCVAFLTHALQADFGVVISASHNPAPDNGLKFFTPLGDKIPDTAEQRIEAMYNMPLAPGNEKVPGRHLNELTAIELYTHHLYRTYNGLDLRGRKIALDCAHGALSFLAPKVFEHFGADVVAIGNQPDGNNINDRVGATVPSALQKWVLAQNAEVGFSFDGDGDRLIAVTGKGEILDGDQLLGVLAQGWLKQGRMQKGATIVSTVMANRNLKTFLKQLELSLMKAPVGDRWVVEKMNATAAVLGGESSGHLILKPLSTTGDGLLVALELLSLMQAEGQPLTRPFSPAPQVLKNVKVSDRSILQTPLWQGFLQSAETKYAESCDILIRPSGTEPVIRVMVQGEDEALVHEVCHELCAFLEATR